MAKHRLKQKKILKGTQFDVRDFLYVRDGYVPVSHHREDRTGFCGRCGHPWEWHDNVWLKMLADGAFVQPRLRCRGGYQAGLSVSACKCRETYPG